MSDTAIKVEGLSKRYRIGERLPYRTLRDDLSHLFRGLSLFSHSKNGTVPISDSSYIWALKDVSFEVKRGDIVGIIGRNGAGKTTLLKILSKITEPTEGRAEINGRVGSLLEVGTGFHPELTGRENIYLNGAILGMKKWEIDKRFDEIVAFSEIEKFLDTPVKHYSSGMYVRLAFSVAAHLETEILLVDEVLAVGDAAFQKKCLGKTGQIGRQGRTVLYVSHNLPTVINLCPSALLLAEGRIVFTGASPAVVREYLTTHDSQGAEVVWEDPEQAPGNEIVRLHAVRIFQDNGEKATGEVDISKDVFIEISYWNLRDGTLLYPAIWLRDQTGSFVLASSNHGSVSLTKDPFFGKPYPIGLYRSVCRIPGNFLNEGTYSVTAIVGKNTQDTQILQDYAVSFRVYDTGEMRKEFSGDWIGVVRPRLAWETKPVQGREL